MSALLAAALSLLVPAVARAGLATSDTIGSGDVGKTLKNNTVYVVPKSATLTRTTPYSRTPRFMSSPAPLLCFTSRTASRSR